MNSEFDTQQYLIAKRNQNYVIGDSDFPVIDRLCKKVDVVKKVYQVYSADLSSKLSNEEVGHNRYQELFELLLSAATLLEDYKFLNTALKLNDLLFKRGMLVEKKAEENSRQLSDLIITFSQNCQGADNERS